MTVIAVRHRLTERFAVVVVVAMLAALPTHATGAAKGGGLLAGRPSSLGR